MRYPHTNVSIYTGNMSWNQLKPPAHPITLQNNFLVYCELASSFSSLKFGHEILAK